MPTSLGPLTGRERDIDAAAAVLSHPDTRLLTLTGPGGVGKTRLALEVARRCARRFHDGAELVDLSALRDARLVIPEIARSLGVQQTKAGELAPALHDRHLLLMLDNLEHVSAAAPELGRLLAACPDLKVLGTSRVRLRLRGEQVYLVQPLPVPPPGEPIDAPTAAGYASVTVFVHAARSVAPGFALDPANVAAVAEICRRLDGLPLALELATARLGVLEPGALLERMTPSLPVLVGDASDSPDRHRSLSAAIDGSYRLLTPAERELFRSLAVFRGGFRLDAVEAVSGDADAVDLLAGLVDASLVRREAEGGPTPRFRMLETIREFADQKLQATGQQDALRRRHTLWCLELAETARAASYSPAESAQLERLSEERANWTAALAWCATEDGAVGRRLATALAWFFVTEGPVDEGYRWAVRFLEHDPGTPSAVADAVGEAGLLACLSGDIGRAAPLIDEATSRWRALDLIRPLASALGYASTVAFASGDWVRALTASEEAVALARDTGDQVATAIFLYSFGEALALNGRPREAERAFEESLALLTAAGFERPQSWALSGLANLHLAAGVPAAAATNYGRAIALAHKYRSMMTVLNELPKLAGALVANGETDRAAFVLGVAASLRTAMGGTPIGIEQQDRATAVAREAIGTDRYDAARRAGRARPLDAAVADGFRYRPTTRPGQATELTRREREVLEQLAHGLTDQVIAAALFISVRTVQNHVAHIFDKLGVRTRTAAAHAFLTQQPGRSAHSRTPVEAPESSGDG